MLASQRIALEMSQVRQQINDFPEDGEDAKRDELTTRYQSLESQYRAALVTEDTQEVDRDGDTPEGRELGRMRDRASIAGFILEVANGQAVDGANKEFREAVLGEDLGGYMPVDMLEMAQRADAVSSVATIQDNQMPIFNRVFNRGSSGYLGVMMPSVPVGSTSYPRLNAGTTADVRDDGVELDGAAATLETVQLNPVRLTASYTYGVESLSRVSGFEEALRRDLNQVIMDKRDALAINGQAAVASTSPAVDGIINSLTNPDDPDTVADYAVYLAAYDDMVDGKYAISNEEVRLLVNANIFQHAMGLIIGAEARGGLLRDRLPMSRFRVSGNMPATVDATKVATAIAYATGAEARGFMMPSWRGIQFVVDPYSQAKKGQVVLTAVNIVGFDMVDGAGYKRLEFKTA